MWQVTGPSLAGRGSGLPGSQQCATRGLQEPFLMVLQVIGPRPAGHHGEAPGQAEAELSSKLKHPNIVETLMFNSFRADKVGGLLHHHQLSSGYLKLRSQRSQFRAVRVQLDPVTV